ncbi:hypothetical protein [Halalkalibacter flavus]|uniref:hypothetical protein n=1 Tax=Halalkalibacter flavus TaxID=3090668 RepID=UPI002FCC65B1
MSVMIAKTLGISIKCQPKDVYEYITNPKNLSEWATTFSFSVKKSESGEWIVETPEGEMKIKYVEKNKFGVADHYIITPQGQEIYNPMRVFPNNIGCEVIFTLFQVSGMSDVKFLEDAELVERDLKNLKNVMEK